GASGRARERGADHQIFAREDEVRCAAAVVAKRNETGVGGAGSAKSDAWSSGRNVEREGEGIDRNRGRRCTSSLENEFHSRANRGAVENQGHARRGRSSDPEGVPPLKYFQP